MNLMNGAPYYSPPSRDTKTYGFGAKQKPLLSELPGLIEKAIKAGLVTRPVEKPSLPPASKEWKHSWHYAICTGCGVQFERGHKHLVQCVTCRRPPRACNGCGKQFQPPTKKRLCCSDACAKIAQRIKHRTKKNK
jgi:hypothetical protein